MLDGLIRNNLKLNQPTYIDVVDLHRLKVTMLVFWKWVVAAGEGDGPVHEIEIQIIST